MTLKERDRLMDAIQIIYEETNPAPGLTKNATLLGVDWALSGDGKTYKWYASIIDEGLEFAIPLDECRYTDGRPWKILKK